MSCPVVQLATESRGSADDLILANHSLARQGRSADAEWVKRAFDEAWRDADTTLTIEAL
jgi:hypothetical protein